jgi:hypothetical protein
MQPFHSAPIRSGLALCLLCGCANGATIRLLVPAPVVSAAARLQAASDPGHFMFAVAGDNRATAKNVPMPPTARQIFSEFRLLRPAFTLWTGDAIYGSDDTVGEAEAEWSDFLAAADQGRTPLFNAPGNHEIYDRRDLESLYEKTCGLLYGSFDYGNSHFIALDTEEVGRKPGISALQRAWLEADLEANRQAANTFVFMHHPLFPKKAYAGWDNPAERDAVHQLFVHYGVKYVFAGHEHLYHRSVHDGINYVVTGGGGAPNDAGPETGAFQHYLLLTVNDRDIALTVVEPWRLFAASGPVSPNGSCAARIDNYNADDFSVVVELPSDALGARAAASAAFTSKGPTHPVSAAIIPADSPGATAVRVTVPRTRSVLVSIAPGIR